MSSVDQSKSTLASEEDIEKLNELGYKQELYRGMNVLMTFSTSFTAVAVISSLIPLYPTAVSTGGPAVVVWSWIGVSILTIMTGLIMYISCHSSISQASWGEMFTKTYNGTGIDSFGYVVLIGTLSAFYSFTGYEAAGHLSEETLDAEKSVPKGILYTCAATGIIGFCFLLSLVSLTANDIDSFLNNDAGVFGIFQQCVSTDAALALVIIMSINLLFSGMSSLTVTVRMVYALARDGGFPFSSQIKQVQEHNKVPGWAVLATFLMGELLILLQLISSDAFIAVTSISTIGFQISYAIPIILRLTTYRNEFQPSYFTLGKFAIPCGIVASLSLVSTSFLFLLPTTFPITAANFNYTPVVFVGTGLLAWVYWICHASEHYISPHLHTKQEVANE
ncbi:hypothetical protein HDV01_005280 [Terramyces sp. JEL0728]|nr:hypothetical protein HDV01_005280 [Terramyces sp. JEL0728]